MTWKELQDAASEMAAFGRQRFDDVGVAYLATIRQDGSPRVHPVTPIVGQGRLFLFMEPTSPKGHDLRRDGRYALHSAVDGPDGGGGEFIVRGRATFVDDPETRVLASQLASYTPAERYILFELSVDQALSTVYDEEGQPVRRQWKRGD